LFNSFQWICVLCEYPAEGFDLICFFDCLHDMGDPVGAAQHAKRALADDGTVMLVEPFANDRVFDFHAKVHEQILCFSEALEKES